MAATGQMAPERSLKQETGSQIETLVFRYGRDMAPTVIAAETPGARFVARAQLIHGTATGDASSCAPAGAQGTVWGILLIQPEPPTTRSAADVITDAGRVTHAIILTGSDALDDIGAVVKQARSWELSPSYIDGLDKLRAERC